MRFALKAVDGANRVTALELDAADEAAAREVARQRGLAVLALRRRGLAFSGGKPFPTTLFSIELLALLDAGLNIVEALQTLTEKEPQGESRRVLTDLLDGLYRGESFSQSVERFPDAFSPVYVATLRSSERTGDMREALGRYIGFQEELDRVRKKAVAALLYPAILTAAGGLVLAFLLFYVVPRFARVYDEISTELPLFSSLLLGAGRWIEGHSYLLAVLAIGVVAGAVYALSSAGPRARLFQELLRVPALGQRVHVYQLARFYRTVGMLLRAGIPALRALRMVEDLLPLNLRSPLSRAAAMLQEGRTLSAALTAVGLATPVATRMLAVGEKSGQAGELMERIAKFYDDDTARWIEAFTRVFEPALMAVLGLAVGGVVVLMYMPVFELAGSLQ